MNYQTICLNIGNYGCLLDCYLEAAARISGQQLDHVSKFNYMIEAIGRGYVDDECFVNCGTDVVRLINPKLKVTKGRIDEIDKFACVRYTYNGKSHWTLWDRNGLVYNGLDVSNCVRFGEPVFNDVRLVKGF